MLFGENWCWSLLGRKGLIVLNYVVSFRVQGWFCHLKPPVLVIQKTSLERKYILTWDSAEGPLSIILYFL